MLILVLALTRISYGYQIMLSPHDRQCFLADLRQQEQIVLVYEISDQEKVEETPDSLRFTFRHVGNDVFLSDNGIGSEGSRNYTYVAQEPGRYEYCFIGEQEKSPMVKLTFYVVVIPSSEEGHKEIIPP